MSKLHDHQNTTRTRSNTGLTRFSHEEFDILNPVLSRTSLQSITGDFPTRQAVECELELKRQCVEAKRVQAAGIDCQTMIHPPCLALLRVPSEATRVEDAKSGSDLVVWAENDPENPQNFSFRRKVWITLVSCVLTINVTFASSAPSSAVGAIAEAFSVSAEASVLITSIFLCGYIVGPIVWAPASELFGRRPIFLGTFLVYTLIQLGQSLGKNFGTVIVTRFIAGLFAAAPLTNCGGVIVDIWEPATRGIATSLYSGSLFVGPMLGPIVGGFVVDSYLGWRWIFWLLIIYAGFCWILVVFLFQETYSPVLLSKRAKRLREEDPKKHGKKYAEHERVDYSFKVLLERTVYRPLIMLAQEPILLMITIYLAIVYGLLYALFSVFPIIWGDLRGFSASQSGLIFVGIGIGSIIGTIINIYLQRHYDEFMSKWHGFPPPEIRLHGAMVSGPFLIVGIFWLGFTGAYPSVSWYVPALSTIPIGISFTLIFVAYLSYIVDTYLLFAASALAACTIFRSAVGAAFPLFTSQMFNALGVQYACTLVGGVAIVMLPVPFVFHKYGHKIRERSRFAPCEDLKIRAQVKKEQKEFRQQQYIKTKDNNDSIPSPNDDLTLV